MGIGQTNLSVALVDNHLPKRSGLADRIRGMGGYEVLLEVNNGSDFIRQVDEGATPDIALLDAGTDGYETAAWLRSYLPQTGVLALSSDEMSIIGMLRLGARGWVSTDVELEKALQDLATKGYYHPETATDGLILSDQEQELLTWCCTELTDEEIASGLSSFKARKEALCEKLQTNSRVGLVAYAIRNGLVRV